MREAQTTVKKIRWAVFLPPWLLLIALLVLNLTNYDTFILVMDKITKWILTNFSWLFNSVTFIAVAVIVISYITPIKNVRFGGSKCRPMMKYTNYIWIILCTILAAGILLWACAEPMYHLYAPPVNVAGGPGSGDAVVWAMQTVLLEWTFSPMAIYALPALLFAFVFYNMKQKFAISSMLAPTIGTKRAEKITPVVDSVCLFALCAGMAASLGSGVLLLGGGLESLSGGGIQSSAGVWLVCGIVIIVAFVVSAASGVMNGIRILSTVNSRIYMIMGAFVFMAGPTAYLLDFMVESAGLFLNDFLKLSLWTSTSYGDGWSQNWPTFYWCCMLAWMPVSAVFIGRMSKGYSVKETIEVIFFFPSVFSFIWLVIFSGTAINFELAGYGVNEAMVNSGTAAATYAVFERLPLQIIMIPLFLLIVFVSFVTAADSNTNAMSGLCTEGLTVDDTESPVILKIVWGLTIGALCIIMLVAFDVEGLKKLSNLGGFPSAFLMIFCIVGWIKIMRNPKKYDLNKMDYEEDGRPIKSERLLEENYDPDKKSFLEKIFGKRSKTGEKD